MNYEIIEGIKPVKFTTNTTCKFDVNNSINLRTCIIVCIETNSGLHIFDVIFVNNRELRKIINLADSSSSLVSYSIVGNEFIITCKSNWSYGFYIYVDSLY